MPEIDFFIRLGLFGIRDFLDEPFRAKLIAEAKSAATAPVRTVDRAGTGKRKADWAFISKPTYASLESKLGAIKPALQSHFSLSLTGYEEPQHVVYKPGDFYRPHTDYDSNPLAPEFVRNRKVSIVVFLNCQNREPGAQSYDGGSLTLFGLIKKPGWVSSGFELVPEKGLLIAFRSDIRHEVKPVIHGRRHTIVSWFF